jgi:hypothetical protein
LIVAALSLLRPDRAAAQTYEIGGGYTYLRDVRTDLDFARGWSIDVGRKLFGVWAVGQVDGHYHSLPFVIGDADLSLHSVMAGGRITAGLGRVREFAQVLGGTVRSRGVAFGSTSSEFRGALQLGLGLDAPIHRRLAARLQFDARSLPSEDWKLSEVRVVVGLAVVIP